METKIINFKNFKAETNVYYTERNFADYETAINKAVRHFRMAYSKDGDKRLATTKMKPNVSMKGKLIYVSMDFNKGHYGQAYLLEGYNDFKFPTYEY